MCETILPEREIYNKYLIKHYKNHKVLTDLLEYHFVELSKFDKDKPATLRNRFEKWLHILKFGNYYRSEADLPGELKTEKGIIEVIKNMSIANTDEQMRHELLARDMFLSDLATDLHAAEQKGRQEGEQLRCEKIALKMIARGTPFEEISEITELPIEQIEKLAEKNNKKVSEPSTKYKTKRPKY